MRTQAPCPLFKNTRTLDAKWTSSPLSPDLLGAEEHQAQLLIVHPWEVSALADLDLEACGRGRSAVTSLGTGFPVI